MIVAIIKLVESHPSFLLSVDANQKPTFRVTTCFNYKVLMDMYLAVISAISGQ